MVLSVRKLSQFLVTLQELEQHRELVTHSSCFISVRWWQLSQCLVDWSSALSPLGHIDEIQFCEGLPGQVHQRASKTRLLDSVTQL